MLELSLDDISVEEVDETNPSTYRVIARSTAELSDCPGCGSQNIRRHGSVKKEFIDSPMNGRYVVILVTRQRYKCAACGKTASALPNSLLSNRAVTERLSRQAGQACLLRTFAEVSQEFGLDEKTLRGILDDHIDHLDHDVEHQTPRTLGIRSVRLKGQMRILITNIGRETIYDILPSTSEAALREYLIALKDPEKVSTISINLNEEHRRAVSACFPSTPVAVEPSDVRRVADHCVDNVLKHLGQKLSKRQTQILQRAEQLVRIRRSDLKPSQTAQLKVFGDPARSGSSLKDIVSAYEAKEDVYEFFESRDQHEGEAKALQWLQTLKPEIAGLFSEMQNTLRNWWPEIHNWHLERPTDSLVQVTQDLANSYNARGRGYKFKIIRAKLLYDRRGPSNSHKPLLGSASRRTRSDSRPKPVLGFVTNFETTDLRSTQHDVEYGPSRKDILARLSTGVNG